MMNLKNETTFGERLRLIRQRLKLKQKGFALKLQTSAASLSEIENDKYKPGHDFFINLVKSYHVNLYYLLFGEGEMFMDSFAQGSVIFGYAGDNQELKRFLWHFQRSPILQHFILG